MKWPKDSLVPKSDVEQEGLQMQLRLVDDMDHRRAHSIDDFTILQLTLKLKESSPRFVPINKVLVRSLRINNLSPRATEPPHKPPSNLKYPRFAKIGLTPTEK